MPNHHIPLNAPYIQKELAPKGFKVHYFETIPSTNTYLNELPPDDTRHLCIAETQTAGKGRLGRYWDSPSGENIYCSIRWPIHCPVKDISELSLLVGASIIKCLTFFDISEHITLKHPNDVLWMGRKVSGILIETNVQQGFCTQIIVGVGLNINSQSHDNPLINQPWCSLFDITGIVYDRTAILIQLIETIWDDLRAWGAIDQPADLRLASSNEYTRLYATQKLIQ
jgi:BirA family biotin operon repressor/biotin-[acetyl-CoA-carboxylase] ligase